jgi:hypothetical protein
VAAQVVLLVAGLRGGEGAGEIAHLRPGHSVTVPLCIGTDLKAGGTFERAALV